MQEGCTARGAAHLLPPTRAETAHEPGMSRGAGEAPVVRLVAT